MRQVALYIDGAWISAEGRPQEDILDPATGQVTATAVHALKTDLDHALAAARKGFAVWRRTPSLARARLMETAAQTIRSRREAIATILTEEQGKPLAEAKAEVDTAADMISWLAEEGKRAYGRVIPSRVPGLTQLTFQEPIGPSLGLTPWNFPAVSPARKIGGALAAGCSLIIKPSGEVPGTCAELVRAFHDAGLPAGVLNLVNGVPAEVSEHLISSPIIRKVSFTGSVPVGRHLAALAARGPKPVTMELGGHAPVLVFGDADPVKCADASVAMKFRNAGQICTSPTRFLVHASIRDAFVRRFAEQADMLTMGSGLDAATTVGPLANARRVSLMHDLVDDARARGAVVETSRNGFEGRGFFFPPTVLTRVPAEARVMTEEPFGPIAVIQPFTEFDEAVELANSLSLGLAAYAFTESTRAADAAAAALEAGVVGINNFSVTVPETPLGGVKDSGYGREGGSEGVEAFMVTKFVARS
ncbi:NAD-dependent succinate-semialdehyde dehydrogenase [Rhizobium binxianense]